MNITVNQHQFSVDDHGAQILWGRDGRCCTAFPIHDFSMQVQCGNQQYALTSEQFSAKKLENGTLYENSFAQVFVAFAPSGNAIAKKITVTAKQSLTLLYMQTEFSRFTEKLSGGGEGQPVFAGNNCFIASVLPVAIERIIDDYCLSVEQSPWKALQPGEAFKLHDVIFGFAETVDIRDSFIAWLRSQRKDVGGRRIFCDWGAHDETAGETPLDEAMAMRLADRIEYAKSLGVSFDSYLMDAYWFEETVPNPDFKEKEWPHGPERFIARLKKIGVDFGLWFDVGIAANKLAGEYQRRNDSEIGLCMGCEENIQVLFSGIRKQLSATGAKLIKLDFASFDCGSGDHTHAKGGVRSKEPAVRNLIMQLDSLRKQYPDLLILAYNTFTVDMEVIARIDENADYAVVSPMWCLYLDYIYCGDPRPGEHIPEGMPQSLLSYTDAMELRFLRALMPPEAIDDHGTMIGNTNTIYYLGKKCFRDSWIMNLARGNRKQHLYGEISLLSDADWQFIAQSTPLFERTLGCDWTVQLHGNPMCGKSYAYSCFDKNGGFLAMVNPGTEEETLCVIPTCWKEQEEIFLTLIYSKQEFTNQDLGSTNRALVRTLQPGSVELVSWARKEKTCKEGLLVIDSASSVFFTVPEKSKRIGFRLVEENGTPIRTFGTPADALTVSGALERQFQKNIWSGCSWMTYNCHGGETVVLRSHFDHRILLHWQVVSETSEQMEFI